MKQNNDKPTIKEDLICYRNYYAFIKTQEKMILKNCDHMCL